MGGLGLAGRLLQSFSPLIPAPPAGSLSQAGGGALMGLSAPVVTPVKDE